MIGITDKTTVSEVARAFPAAVRVFEQYGIDFCCGGNKELGEACREKGVPMEGILAGMQQAQAAQAPDSTDWSSASLSELVDHILTKHHAYLWKELPRLSAMLAKVIEVHGERHPELRHPLGDVYAALQRELEEHMWKEENVLFPLVKRLEAGPEGGTEWRTAMPVGGPIRVMQMEHDSAGAALRQIRRATSDYQVPEDACNTYRALFDGLNTLEADTHQHIHLENNILFPKAIELEG